MQCLYCKTPLSPLRAIADAQFCSDDHRLMQAVDNADPACLFLYPMGEPRRPPQLAGAPEPASFEVGPADPEIVIRNAVWSYPREGCGAEPLDLVPGSSRGGGDLFMPQPKVARRPLGIPRAELQPRVPALGRLVGRHRPRFLPPARYWKIAGWLVPALFVAMLDPPTTTAVPHREDGLLMEFGKSFAQVRETMRSRAAVNLSDDFGAGLDAWSSRSDLDSSWKPDANGFMRPGALAVYRPTIGLSNYSLAFVTQLEQRPLGAAYRVQDFDHYYALKLRISNSSSRDNRLPDRLEMVRYTVIDGRRTGGVVRSFPVPIRNLSLHHMQLEAQGKNFSLMMDGKVVDEWSDARYPQGGVGLFSGNGERARVLWIEVSHQYDLLGRLCALFTPPLAKEMDGSWSEK